MDLCVLKIKIESLKLWLQMEVTKITILWSLCVQNYTCTIKYLCVCVHMCMCTFLFYFFKNSFAPQLMTIVTELAAPQGKACTLLKRRLMTESV